jgi:uncharacterized sulfatase
MMKIPRKWNRPLSRRHFIKAGGAALGAMALPKMVWADAGTTRRPDVLLLVLEDVSPMRFGCYGNPLCRTPNIDRLASQGVRFTNAHTNPPCSPSRVALLTGLRPETTGIFDNGQDDMARATFAKRLLLPERLRAAGYETIRVGKIGHPDKPSNWDRQPTVRQYVEARRPARGPAAEPGAKRLGSPFAYGPTGLDDREQHDGCIADAAIEVLGERRDRPLFLAVGFFNCHLPFRAPDKYFEMYPAEKIVVPKNPGSLPDGMPTAETWERLRQQSPWNRMGEFNPGTLQHWREAIAAHYACLTFADAQVGRVLDALDKSGRADNTVVVLWSDHGFMLGEHFLWRKGPPYNESTKSALIVRAPGIARAGAACARPVECMDLFPTLLDVCGLPVPADIECTSFRPLLSEPDRSWKKAALMTGPHGSRSIVTERWRYTEYTDNAKTAPELFDHERDPGEFTNLAREAGHADVVKELSGLLRAGWRACLPDR